MICLQGVESNATHPRSAAAGVVPDIRVALVVNRLEPALPAFSNVTLSIRTEVDVITDNFNFQP